MGNPEVPQFPPDEEGMSPLERMEMYAQWVAMRGFIKAHERIEKEAHGGGCGCNTCLHQAVRDMNDWLNFMDRSGEYFRYEIEYGENGKPRVVTPEEQIEALLQPDYKDPDLLPPPDDDRDYNQYYGSEWD